MNCDVTLFKDTGFNSINRPDSPDTLAKAGTTFRLWAMDVLDSSRLASIKVKVDSLNDLAGADYLMVSCPLRTFLPEMYYIITDYMLTSPDVAEIQIIPDYVLALGGYDQLKILEGIVERCTTDNAADLWSYVNMDDEYASPSQPLKVKTNILWGKENSEISPSGTVILESTVDLRYPIDWDDSNVMSASGSTVTTTPVLQPKVHPVVGRTTYKVDFSPNGAYWAQAPGTRQFLYENGTNYSIPANVAEMQSLGVTSALVSSVVYPNEYFPEENIHSSNTYVSYIESKIEDKDSGLKVNAPYQYTSKYNPVIFMNPYNKYGIITAAGDQAEFNVTELCEKQSVESMKTYSPKVAVLPDPRPSGKPYFRFHGYLHTGTGEGDSFTYKDVGTFLQGAISGLPWANAQLTYQGASGSYFNSLRYGIGQMQASLDYTKTRQMAESNFRNSFYDYKEATAKGAISAANGWATFASAGLGKPEDMASGYLSGMNQMSTSVLDFLYREGRWKETQQQTSVQLQYNAQAFNLQQELNASNYTQSNTVAPTIAFAFNADMYRDFCGNGVTAYRYYYSEDDVIRIDKLLSMYGIKTNRNLEIKDFHRKTYFDYVRASGVSIGSQTQPLPMYVRESIAASLNVGIRVWHGVKPGNGFFGPGQNPEKEV